jgi:hypothetical protein
MSSELDQQMIDFVVILESLPAEQYEQVPFWTEIDDVAKIDPSEFVCFEHSNLDHAGSVWSKSTLINGRRIFERIPQFRPNSPRTVTFSPRIEVQPIGKNKRCYLDENNRYYTRTPTSNFSQPLDPLRVINNSDKSSPLPQDPKAADENSKSLELLNEDLNDLVPPDFEIFHSEVDQIFANSINLADSDSVSYVSNSDDDYDDDY